MARHIPIAKKRGARITTLDIRVSDAYRSAPDKFIVKPGTEQRARAWSDACPSDSCDRIVKVKVRYVSDSP